MNPKLVLLKDFDSLGVYFEVTSPVESFRIEKFGDEEEFTRKILAELRKDDVFFDIGASVGFVTIHAARIAQKVVSFEPDPHIQARLQNNISLNHFQNVQVVGWAVSDHAGEVDFYTDGVEGASPSLREVGRRGKIVLPSDAIDHALSAGLIPSPDVIKVDIEGAEMLCFRGMKELFESDKAPRTIFLEIHPEFLVNFGSSEKEVVDFLAERGYTVFEETLRDRQKHMVFRKTSNHSRIKDFYNIHKGERCVIIGNGPSLNKMDLSFLKNEITFGMNRIYLLCDKWQFMPTYYVSVNSLVIEQSVEEIRKMPSPKFLSLSGYPYLKDADQVLFLKGLETPAFSRNPEEGVWEGHTVTFVAMQLAYYMGFSEVYLIGVDHYFSTPGKPDQEVTSNGSDPNHFDPNYFGKGVRWQLPNLAKSEIAYSLARRAFEADGRKVYDATAGGKLTVFPKVDYDDLFLKKKDLKPKMLEEEPLVSCIVWSRGNAQELKKSIDSLLKQTFPRLQVIVVGKDSQAVRQTVQNAGDRLPVEMLLTPGAEKMAKAFNRGLEAARGEYITYLEEGAEYHPDHISLLEAWLHRQPEWSAAYTSATGGERLDKPVWASLGLSVENSTPLQRLLVTREAPISCLMHRREMLQEVGGFDETSEFLEDWEFLIRISASGKLAAVQSATVDSPRDIRLKYDLKLINCYRKIYQQFGDLATPDVKNAQEKFLRSFMLQYVRFAGGFYEDEGGWRWINQEGNVTISAQALTGTVIISFGLSCAPAAYYDQFPFDVSIVINGMPFKKIQFFRDNQLEKVEMQISRSSSDVQVQIIAGGKFIPAQKGINDDQRQLSIMLSQFTIRADEVSMGIEENIDQPKPEEMELPEETSGKPPLDLIGRTSGFADADLFWKSGLESLQNIRTALAITEKTFSDFPRILDWGCGCGRLLLHLADAGKNSEVYGLDVDGEAVGWCRRFIPWAKTKAYDGRSLSMFEDNSFDLVINQSGFTRLPESYQDIWLTELERVLKPGGMAVLSVLSDYAFFILERVWEKTGVDATLLKTEFISQGILYLTGDQYINEPFSAFYHSTFHTPGYIFSHWSQYVDILAYLPRGALNLQDLILVRKREG